MKHNKFLVETYPHARIIALASLGGILELFDFTIYAFFAPYISFNFFSQDSKWVGLLNTFAIFLIGYCARPLGGVIFGHFGDKYGRKKLFSVSILLMALSTLLIRMFTDI